MQQSDLRARVQRGADWMRRGIDPNANGMEPEIAAGMQRLEKGVRDAQQAMGAAPQQGNDSQQGIETALNRVERLRNQLGGLSRDGQGRQQGQGQGRGSRAAQGQGQGGQAIWPGGNQGALEPQRRPGRENRRRRHTADAYGNTNAGGGGYGTRVRQSRHGKQHAARRAAGSARQFSGSPAARL